MDDDKGLIAAIKENPADDVRKMVYADWLEERGDPRGRFLRLSLALRQSGEGGDAQGPLSEWDRLRRTMKRDWIAIVDRACAEDDVREAVFRHEFSQHTPRGVYFIHIDGDKDPSPQLLFRFKSHRPTVKAASAARSDDESQDGVFDRESGEGGTLFWVGEIVWANGKQCRASGGYYSGALASAGYEYEVRLKRGKWAITDQKTALSRKIWAAIPNYPPGRCTR